MIEAPLYNKLVSASGVNALIGNRVYEFESIEAIYPYVTYSVEDKTIDFLNSPAYTRDLEITIASVALDSATSRQLADQVKLAINLQTGTWTNITVQYCGFIEENSADIADSTTPGRVYYIKEQQYQIMGYINQ